MSRSTSHVSPLLLKFLIVIFGLVGILRTIKAAINFAHGILPVGFWAWLDVIIGPLWIFVAISLYMRLKQQRDQPPL